MGQRLGQHFLKNDSILKKIVAELDLGKNETVVEIGPGHGELSRFIVDELRALGGKLIAVEKDERLAELIRKKYLNNNVEVVAGDVLKSLDSITQNFKNRSYKIVGNIPYYITGHLLRIIGELKNKPGACVFLTQEEVAERIVSLPPKMNRLAAAIQFWAEPKIVASVSRENFSPKPKVDSAVIKLETLTQESDSVGDERYYGLIRALFKQPRKTVLNNLVEAGWQKAETAKNLDKIGINPTWRPQNLSIEVIKKIAGIQSDKL